MPPDGAIQSVELLRNIWESIRDTINARFDPEESMTTVEAARFLKVHRQQLLRYKDEGLVYYEMGKGLRFRRQDLIEFRFKFMKGGDQNETLKGIRDEVLRLRREARGPGVVPRNLPQTGTGDD